MDDKNQEPSIDDRVQRLIDRTVGAAEKSVLVRLRAELADCADTGPPEYTKPDPTMREVYIAARAFCARYEHESKDV